MGCLAPGRAGPRHDLGTVSTQLSKEELAEILAQYVDTFEASLRDVADRMVTLQPDRHTRRLTLLLQTRLLPMMRDAVEQEDALYGLLDAWILCQRTNRFFVDGDGRTMFGEHQSIVVDASRNALERMEDVAARILTPDALPRARRAVEDVAQRFPLRGEFAGATVRSAVQKPEQEAGILTAILTAPIAPFRAFEGIDRGAAAIQGFTAVASRMNETVHNLPESVRLQAQLLLLEMDDLESVQSALTSMEKLAASSARISTVAEQLPEELRRQIGLAAEDLESRQAELQRTLREAQQTAVRVHDALGRVESAAAAVERTAAQTAAAGEAWTRTSQAIVDMVDSFRRPRGAPGDDRPATPETMPANRPSGEPADPTWSAPAIDESAASAPNGRRGFDINEYTLAAQAIDRAAMQVQELSREIRGLAGSRELSETFGDAEQRARGVVDLSRTSAADLVALTRAQVVQVVDHITWRAVQLLALFFMTLAAYRLLARRLAGRSTTPPARGR